MALFKKGKKTAGGAKKKGKGMRGQDMMGGQGGEYNEMLTPRNEGVPQNMERVEEDQEEDMAGHEESQQ